MSTYKTLKNLDNFDLAVGFFFIYIYKQIISEDIYLKHAWRGLCMILQCLSFAMKHLLHER